MQAAGVNQVQQNSGSTRGTHEAVDNLPSSGVPRHIKVIARNFGRTVAMVSGSVPFVGSLFGAHLLMTSNDRTMLLVGAGLLATGVALAMIAVSEIAKRECMLPGGFIFERVCTILDANERQAAEVDIPVRPERYLR